MYIFILYYIKMRNYVWKIFWNLECIDNWYMKKRIYWLHNIPLRICKYRCVLCGNVVEKIHWNVYRNVNANCWCITNNLISISKSITWLSKTRFWQIWTNIKRRCMEKNNCSYDRYWWRWIKNEWKSLTDFANDMYDSYILHCKQFWEKDTSIDRIDNDWNYCKKNCKRSTHKEQQNNRANNKTVVYKWNSYNICDLANKSWINRNTFLSRISKRKWTVDRAVEEPINISKRNRLCK